MGRFGLILRALLAAVLMTATVQAEDNSAPAEAWQVVITAQVEAFRAHDATGAFQYASAPFQTAFPSAEAFFASIIGSGYGPIMDSSSHSFGKFVPLDERSMAQEVTFTGEDLSRYEAIYLLTEEEKGWRVSGVQLVKTPGMAI
jgi:hypothetical protein